MNLEKLSEKWLINEFLFTWNIVDAISSLWEWETDALVILVCTKSPPIFYHEGHLMHNANDIPHWDIIVHTSKFPPSSFIKRNYRQHLYIAICKTKWEWRKWNDAEHFIDNDDWNCDVWVPQMLLRLGKKICTQTFKNPALFKDSGRWDTQDTIDTMGSAALAAPLLRSMIDLHLYHWALS